MLAALVLGVAASLPPVIADPRTGPSAWQVVAAEGALPDAGAEGYLVELPPRGGGASQAWLERVVALAARRVPVVSLGPAPPAPLRPYLDGAAVEGVAAADLGAVRVALGGLALVAPARDAAGTVAALAAGASSVLVPSPPPSWQRILAGLLPAAAAARGEDGRALATGMRVADLATVVGLPAGFPGGAVALAGTWHGEAALAGGETLPEVPAGDAVRVEVPPLPAGGLLVVQRPGGGGAEVVEVRGERVPTAAEILARHQRAAAVQARLLTRWIADQRLLLRIWVTELARSVELVLEGPAFWQEGTGRDWEIARAWVDGVSWDPVRLPELPLVEPERPPVPPLALRLEPGYSYVLDGVTQRRGRRCYVLGFDSGKGPGPRRRGTAWIDAGDFGLVELFEVGEDLGGAVGSTSSTTVYEHLSFEGAPVSLPARVTADDLMSAFGGTVSLHRELSLSGVRLDPAGFETARSEAYRSPRRMFRETPGGLRRLLPDGHGGRVVGDGSGEAQRYLLGGVMEDPGLTFPVPFGGLQIQDFDFRHRGEQLRLLLAGAVNDGAWSARRGRVEVSLRAFVQLLGFGSTVAVRGRDQRGEELEVRHQRVGAGIATAVGRGRVALDLGVDRWDFKRTDKTAPGFLTPRGTFEGVVRVDGETVLAGTSFSLTAEAGRRFDWEVWGNGGAEPVYPSWQRYRAAVVRETTPFPLARLHLGAEVWWGRHMDRFSAPVPGRFGGVVIRGIAANRVVPDRLVVSRLSLAVPLAPAVRGEVGVDAAWARDPRSGYEARPLSGVSVGVSVPGPWGTLLQGSVGFPLATPGGRSATAELFVLKPLSSFR